ncbi:AAA family ATPase [Paludisphaera soli]|uniref:AAA family ATPase n=1 Tax=Paludisphaera soli TaxID=2712865 RepID=UPI0013ED0A22|nr:AAA family ATPase [Paludisphaera soli]
MLDDRIRSRILDDHKKLTADGKLLSRSQLDASYRTFRSRFGPDVLAGLDGEELLETMHAHGNRDSLVYWLEFKNDDEFPARFGSISGGSAFKFGVFRGKESGNWVSGSPQNVRQLTVQEAVEIARKHRDELIRGTARLGMVPDLADDAEYRGLQVDLGRIAPSVGDLAWGHKYFSLMHPEKLDDYHNADYQRFHLVKLLQVPPEGEGRYLCAGRFVAAADELGLPINHLTTTLNHRDGEPHAYWRVDTSDGTQPRGRWPLMRDGACVAIGWPDLGDLSDFEKDAANKQRLVELIGERHPGTPQQVGRAAAQVLNFAKGIAEGDVVLACDGQAVLGVGRVVGAYVHEPASDFPHRRAVEWLSLDEWRMPEPEGLQTTVHRLRKAPANLVEAERRSLGGQIVHGSPGPGPSKTGGGAAPRLVGVAGRIQAVLERKGQAILYGPPGTGKTYWAERTALDLASYPLAGKPFDGLSEGEKAEVTGGPSGLGSVRMVSFHPAYGYEDFIEGYRPELHEGRMTFALRDGVFKELCRDAEKRPDRPFVLIIDEINRGDVTRIFGELLTVVEKDKRGKSVVLPLSRAAFRVPPNVLLIGTMNTADRSIALLDAALRRRFGFVELMPDASLLEGVAVADVPLGPWLEALNRRICEHVGRDARNLQVGHSFLMEAGRPVRDAARFFRVVRDEIIPLLEEYCYEDFDALHAILGGGLVDLPNRAIRHELFEGPTGPELGQALLAPCPEVLTSLKAVTSLDEAEADEDEPDAGSPS